MTKTFLSNPTLLATTTDHQWYKCQLCGSEHPSLAHVVEHLETAHGIKTWLRDRDDKNVYGEGAR
jgi:hypothetical protein